MFDYLVSIQYPAVLWAKINFSLQLKPSSVWSVDIQWTRRRLPRQPNRDEDGGSFTRRTHRLRCSTLRTRCVPQFDNVFVKWKTNMYLLCSFAVFVCFRCQEAQRRRRRAITWSLRDSCAPRPAGSDIIIVWRHYAIRGGFQAALKPVKRFSSVSLKKSLILNMCTVSVSVWFLVCDFRTCFISGGQ